MNGNPLLSEEAAPRAPWLAPTTRGTLYCGLSALAYGLMGICQRQVATSCDPVLVNCVQASVSTAIFGAYLLFRGLRGHSAWPPLSEMIALLAIGLVTQLGGVAYQWSIGVIGLAIANPLQMGVMLAGMRRAWLLDARRKGVLAMYHGHRAHYRGRRLAQPWGRSGQ